MSYLRDNHFEEVAGVKVVACEDYKLQKRYEGDKELALDHLPKSNVLKYYLEDGSWFAIRPSGTEPKCKFYYEAVDSVKENAASKPDMFQAYVLKTLKLDK